MASRQSELHPIACESCRNKKSKCDRELPICSQCIANEAECRYPPINKRGIPSGYIALLEQRLLETELVLFELLTTLHHPNIRQYRSSQSVLETLAKFSNAQSKNDKIEEWKLLPLALDEQRKHWLQTRQEIIQNSGRPPAKPRSSTGTTQVTTTRAGGPSQESPGPMQIQSDESPQASSNVGDGNGEHSEQVYSEPPFTSNWQPSSDSSTLASMRTSEPFSFPSEEHYFRQNTQRNPAKLQSNRASFDTLTNMQPPANPSPQRWRKYF